MSDTQTLHDAGPFEPRTIAAMMQRAGEIAVRIRKSVGGPDAAREDWLSVYRAWLDRSGIIAETEDGWPTAAAFDEATVGAYLSGLNHTETPNE